MDGMKRLRTRQKEVHDTYSKSKQVPKNVFREQRHLFQLSLVSESRGRVESETVMVKSSAYLSPINLAQMSHPEEKTIKSQIPSQVVL